MFRTREAWGSSKRWEMRWSWSGKAVPNCAARWKSCKVMDLCFVVDGTEVYCPGGWRDPIRDAKMEYILHMGCESRTKGTRTRTGGYRTIAELMVVWTKRLKEGLREFSNLESLKYNLKKDSMLAFLCLWEGKSLTLINTN